ITGDSVIINFTGTQPATGASADNGGTINLTNSSLNNVNDGLAVGVGTISTTNLHIVLVPGPSTIVGAQILNAGGTLTLQGGSITTAAPGGRQSIGLRSENGATLIADGTDISGGFEKSAEATSGGHIELSNLTINQNFDNGGIQHGALEVSGGSTIT